MSIPSKVMSAPNVVNICVDEESPYEMKGNVYHCFSKEGIPYTDVITVINTIIQLCDKISYPQATVHLRNFCETQVMAIEKCNKDEPLMEREQVLQKRGKKATFYVVLTSRANANWQGEVYWVEQDLTRTFCSDRELLVLLLRALSY